MFWLQELLDSELYDDIFQCMCVGWFYGFGAWHTKWFDAFLTLYTKEDTSEDEIVHLFYNLIRIPLSERDYTVLTLLHAGKDIDVSTLDSVNNVADMNAFQYYCHRGKTMSAWIFICHMYIENEKIAWEFLARTIETKKTRNILQQLFHESCHTDILFMFLAYTVSSLCVEPYLKNKNQNPLISVDSFILTRLQEWSMLSIKERRIYDSSCMKMFSHEKTVDELNTLSLTILQKQCPFWQSSVDESYCGTAIRNIPRSSESFWDTYFPYPVDIPDEWSLEEKCKSHRANIQTQGQRQETQMTPIESMFPTKPVSHLLWLNKRIIQSLKQSIKTYNEFPFVYKYYNLYTNQSKKIQIHRYNVKQFTIV